MKCEICETEMDNLPTSDLCKCPACGTLSVEED